MIRIMSQRVMQLCCITGVLGRDPLTDRARPGLLCSQSVDRCKVSSDEGTPKARLTLTASARALCFDVTPHVHGERRTGAEEANPTASHGILPTFTLLGCQQMGYAACFSIFCLYYFKNRLSVSDVRTRVV